MKAAVLQQTGDTKLEVRDDVSLVPVGPGHVRVKIRAAGVCHSDLSAMTGTLPQPAPAVLGHEGAGEIVEVGEGVTALQPGDHVIVNWTPACGACPVCVGGQPNLCMTYTMVAYSNPQFRTGDGSPLLSMAGTGTWAEETVLPQQGAIKIDPSVPFPIAALVGCGVMTGAGAALNSAKVVPGSTVVVIGCGGVGVSAIQGARIAGARVIVAVDPVEQKLEWAKAFGATHSVKPEGLPKLNAELTGGAGFDYAFEVVGHGQTIRAAYDATRRGGMCVIVGAGRLDDMVSFSAFELFYSEKVIQPSYYGSAHVQRDFPRLLGLWQAGKLDLENMITGTLGIDDINQAIDALRSGEALRQIIEF